MTKFHVVWQFDKGGVAMTDVINAHDALDAHKKATKIARDFAIRDEQKRVIVVGPIQRLET